MVKRPERDIRDAMIERLYRQNTPQVEIGRIIGLNPPRVHAVLQRRGVLPPAKPVPHTTTTIWDAAEGDKLRRAIWKRARDGARAALARREDA